MTNDEEGRKAIEKTQGEGERTTKVLDSVLKQTNLPKRLSKQRKGKGRLTVKSHFSLTNTFICEVFYLLIFLPNPLVGWEAGLGVSKVLELHRPGRRQHRV